MMKRFVRYEEAAQYFGIDETLIVAYAKAAGAVYQLSKIRLIKIEPLEDYMKHLTRVGRLSKLIQRKFVRVGEGTLIYNIGRNRFIEMARAAGAVYKIEQREGRGIRQGNENDEIAVYRYVTKSTFDAYNWSLVENKQRFISQVTTSKAVSRTCEDIDEATLSYAEIKAVATGNPLIKEKMEIDNDVQRLKLLKASYNNQRYALQDNFMIRYPKLIKAATEKLACVREDIKLRDKELLEHPDFAITVGKFTYTERADGGAVMLEAVSKCKTGDTTALGSFHGFELLVEKNFMGVNYLILRGKTEYKVELSTSPVGNMVKLENCFNGIHENEEYLLKKIEQYENDLAASKEEYEKPFMHEEELQQKLSRQFELNAQLDLENEKVADADLGGIEGEKCINVAENQLPYQTRQDKPR